MLLVGSYIKRMRPTIAPLPVNRYWEIAPSIGGMFLWHCPHGCPHWSFSSGVLLLEARTFLIPAISAIAKTRLPAPAPPPSVILACCAGSGIPLWSY